MKRRVSLPTLGVFVSSIALSMVVHVNTTISTLPAEKAKQENWPTSYAGSPLTPVPASANDRMFSDYFPGEIRRYQLQSSALIVRWVPQATRKLHPAADCYRGSGFSISYLPLEHNSEHTPMSCFSATKHAESYKVCEHINSDNRTWPDVASWYWHAVFDRQNTSGWWSYVLVTNNADNS